jgi:hypothetical protein
MSTALQFTSVFDPANPPQKLNLGGIRGVPTKKAENITPMGNKKFNIGDMKNLKGTEPRFNILDMQKRAPEKTTEDKMNMLADKALEARGIKTQAIKNLETPPPVSVSDTGTNTLPGPRFMEKFEGLNERQKMEMDKFFNELQELEDRERKQLERDFRDDVIRENLREMYNQQFGERLQAKAMSPDMNMIMRAQDDRTGINQMMSSPIALLRTKDYSGIV